ncbi:hypothetical protein [Candidatus Borrarchaeum sp.]|uniref:hypothetical protein n=1 Tax=Candidatus Borrarchaeum sp. TaxID=2846742 RepID=UPI00257AD8F4|nr:hypothetical protein [Candidatus Borrarchaeum sp.]
MFQIREKDGAAGALEFYEKIWKREDRVKNMTTTLKDVFKIEDNDMNAIYKWFVIFNELIGTEGYTQLEQSKTFCRVRVPIGCAWKTDPKDISDWVLIFFNIVVKTINPKATVERPKGMCAGDSYCEYVYKIEE